MFRNSSVASKNLFESGRRDSNPRRSAWKADALPTELLPRGSPPVPNRGSGRSWRVMDSNHRRHSRQIYSLLPLATRATLRKRSQLSPRRTRWPASAISRPNSLPHSVSTRHVPYFAELKLARGLEPRTPGLQNRCSTVELRQPEPETPGTLAARRVNDRLRPRKQN